MTTTLNEINEVINCRNYICKQKQKFSKMKYKKILKNEQSISEQWDNF